MVNVINQPGDKLILDILAKEKYDREPARKKVSVEYLKMTSNWDSFEKKKFEKKRERTPEKILLPCSRRTTSMLWG
jgi:hypothetical protein